MWYLENWAMAFRMLLLWLFFACNCCAYPTFKSLTASAGQALPQWENVASSQNGKYRADMGIGYQANNSGSWECKLVVENVISESIEKSYACSMAEGYGQDFCSLVVLDGCVMLLSNQDKALVCSLTDYQAANYQYLTFKLDNYGGAIYFDFSLSPPPPSASSSSSSGSSGSKISLKTIGIVVAGVFLIIAACLILKVCYSNHHKQCDCEEEKDKEKEKEKEKICCCECKCKECEVKEQKITYYHYYCPNTCHYYPCPYYYTC